MTCQKPKIYLFGSSLNRFFWRARPSKLLPWRLPSTNPTFGG